MGQLKTAPVAGAEQFRLTVGDLVVLLDAYVDRVDGADGAGVRSTQHRDDVRSLLLEQGGDAVGLGK